MKEPARRLIRFLGVITRVGLLVAVAIGLIVWLQLPSWSTLVNGFRSVKPVAPPAVAVAAPTPAQQPVAAATPAPAPSASPQQRTLPGVIQPAGSVAAYLTERFTRGAGADIGVCNNWIDIPAALPANPAAFGQALEQSANGNVAGNMFVESALAAVAPVLRLPAVGQVMQSMETAASTNDATYSTGQTFRTQLASASADVVANRPALEQAAQHAYHLFVMSRLVSLAPQIASDPQAQALCARVESMVEQPQAISSANMDAEKAEVLRLFARAGVTADQVGFDPNLRNPVQASFSAEGVTLAIPWFTRQFGTPFKIANTMGTVSATTQAPAAPTQTKEPAQ